MQTEAAECTKGSAVTRTGAIHVKMAIRHIDSSSVAYLPDPSAQPRKCLSGKTGVMLVRSTFHPPARVWVGRGKRRWKGRGKGRRRI